MIRIALLCLVVACTGEKTEPIDGVERLTVTADLPDDGARLGWILASAAADFERGESAPTALIVGELSTLRLRFTAGSAEEALQRARDTVSGQYAESDVILVHAGKATLAGGQGEAWITELRTREGKQRLVLPFRRTPLGVNLDGTPLNLPPGEGSGLFRPVQPGAPLPAETPLLQTLAIGWNALPPESPRSPPESVFHRSLLDITLDEAWDAAGWALAHALWSVADGESLATFAVVPGPDGLVFLRFTGESEERILLSARKRLEDEYSLWPAVLVSQNRLDLGFGTVDTLLAEVFRPGAKPRTVALPWRPAEGAKGLTLASLPIFIGGWPSTDRNPVIGTTDAVSPAAGADLFSAFRKGWQLHPYGKRYWAGDVP